MKKINGLFVILFCLLNLVLGFFSVYFCLFRINLSVTNYTFIGMFVLSVLFTLISVKNYVKY